MTLLLVVMSSFLSGCSLCDLLCSKAVKPEGSVVFSGQVLSATNTPLNDATITVNGRTFTTDDSGFFRVTLDSSAQYLVTIRKRGYGLFSRVYPKGVENKNWRLTRSTLTTLDPAVGGIVQDTLSANCLAGRSRSGWDHLEVKGGAVSPALRMALDAAYQPSGCSAGVSITIPANALVDSSGNKPSGLVEVEVSTVDVFSSESMPGDWSVRLPQPVPDAQAKRLFWGDRLGNVVQEGFMQTLGAGSVAITAAGKSYQLKPGSTAKLTVPIDPTAIHLFKVLKQNPPARIPLLVYHESKGTWMPAGEGALNESAAAYTADLPHFSEWNMDVVFSNVACTQIDSRLISGGYYLRAVPSMIPAGGLQPHEFDIPNAPGCSGNTTGDPFYCYIHAAWRLPSNPAHGAGQISFMPGTRTGPNPGDIAYNRANFLVPFGAVAPNQLQMPPTYSQHPMQPNIQPGSYPNCTTAVTFAEKPTVSISSTATTFTLMPSGYWGPNDTIVPNHSDDRYELQWCDVIANPSCATNPADGGWTSFSSLPTISIPGSAVRPGRAVTSAPIGKSSLPAGTYRFRVRAHMGDNSFSIGGSETPWSDPSITIALVGNSPPTLTSIANQTVNVGTLVAVAAMGTDPDNDTLFYSLTTAPPGAMINPTTGGFTWTPSAAQGAMTHSVIVQVTDSGTPIRSASTSFTITVNPQVIIENRTTRDPATGDPINGGLLCSRPIDTSMIRLQVQGNDMLTPLHTDSSDGVIPNYSPIGSEIDPDFDSVTFNPTVTSYQVSIEMGSWDFSQGVPSRFVQRRYMASIAAGGCDIPKYRYLDFTVTQGPGLLTLRVQPIGNQYEVVVQGGTATLSTAAGGQKTTTDFGRTTPYTP